MHMTFFVFKKTNNICFGTQDKHFINVGKSWFQVKEHHFFCDLPSALLHTLLLFCCQMEDDFHWLTFHLNKKKIYVKKYLILDTEFNFTSDLSLSVPTSEDMSSLTPESSPE